MDLKNLGFNELRDLRTKIDIEIKRREQSSRREVLSEIKAIAKAKGYSLDELVGLPNTQVVVRERKPIEIKYRNPNMNTETWTGRGKKPLWIVKWLENGGTLDELLVAKG